VHDPIIRRELLAVVIGKSAESVKRSMLIGKIPRFDASPDRKIHGWRLSTIAAWNPRIGNRLEILLKSPFLPAA